MECEHIADFQLWIGDFLFVLIRVISWIALLAVTNDPRNHTN